MSRSSTRPAGSPAVTPHDFDFLFGSRRIHNRRLDDPFGDSDSWSENEMYPPAGTTGRRTSVETYEVAIDREWG